MGIDQLSPWISLLAGLLSITYLVVDERRQRSDGATGPDGEAVRRISLAAALREQFTVVVTAVTMFFFAGLAHWYLQSTAFFYPVSIWGTAGFIVVSTILVELTRK